MLLHLSPSIPHGSDLFQTPPTFQLMFKALDSIIGLVTKASSGYTLDTIGSRSAELAVLSDNAVKAVYNAVDSILAEHYNAEAESPLNSPPSAPPLNNDIEAPRGEGAEVVKEDHHNLVSLANIGLLHAALALLLWWEICPQLQPGVGSPVEVGGQVRSLLDRVPLFVLNRGFRERRDKGNYNEKRLLKFTRLIHRTILLGQYNCFLAPVYLGYLYASYLQLEASDKRCNTTDVDAEGECLFISDVERGECRREIVSMVDSFPLALSVDAWTRTVQQREAAPSWLINGSAYWFSYVVRQKNGLLAALTEMLSHVSAEDSRARLGAADVVCRMPNSCDQNKEQFLDDICSQVVTLYEMKENKLYQHMAALITSRIIKLYPKDYERVLLRKVFGPLYIYKEGARGDREAATNDDDNGLGIICDDDIVTKSVDNLALLLSAVTPTALILQAIHPLIPAVFMLHFSAAKRSSGIAPITKSILLAYLKLAVDPVELIILLPAFANHSLHWAAGGTGGVSLRVTDTADVAGGLTAGMASISLAPWENESTVIVSLLAEMEDHDIAGKLLTSLLRGYMNAAISGDALASVDEELHTANILVSQCNNSLLLAVLGDLGPNALRDGVQAVECIQSVVEGMIVSLGVDIKATSFADASTPIKGLTLSDGMFDVFNLCFGIMETLFSFVDSDDEETGSALRSMLPSLETIARFDRNTPRVVGLVDSATNIIKLVLSRCSSGGGRSTKIGSVTTSADENEKVRKLIDNALRDIKDPMVPIRAYGVAQLSQVVKDHKQSAGRYLPLMVNVFQVMLLDTDSYLYLGAIMGLVAAGDAFPETVLPALITRFCDNKAPLDQRLKLGEAICKVSYKCGTTIGKYAPRLVSGFLFGVSLRSHEGISSAAVQIEGLAPEDVALFRASCLSNLGEVCDLLRWGISKFLQDIISVIFGVLDLERNRVESVMVRRAAIYMLHRILKGANSDLTSILEGNASALHQLMSRTRDMDQDEIVKGHAQMCMSVMDDYTKEWARG